MPRSITRPTHRRGFQKYFHSSGSQHKPQKGICLPRGLPTKQSAFKRVGTRIRYPLTLAFRNPCVLLGGVSGKSLAVVTRLHSSALVKSLPPWALVSGWVKARTISHESLQSAQSACFCGNAAASAFQSGAPSCHSGCTSLSTCPMGQKQWDSAHPGTACFTMPSILHTALYIHC